MFHSRTSGSSKYPQLFEYALATTNEPLAKGDLVSITQGNGSVDRTCTDGGGDHQEDACIGVCENILYKDSSGRLVESTYVGAAQGDDSRTLGSGTGAIVRVAFGIDALWSVQCDDAGATAIDGELIGTAANPLALEATDPTQLGVSGRSNMEIDTSSAAAAADLFHIVNLHYRPGRVFSSTEADSRFGRALVMFAENLFGQIPTISGVG